MLIQIRYQDNRFDYVKDTMLQRLIENRAIANFRRSSGWVSIDGGAVRQFQRNFDRKPAAPVTHIVRVAYDDERYDYVTEKVLGQLLEAKKIVKFKRITGWVTVGVDPLRKANREHTYRYPTELKRRALS